MLKETQDAVERLIPLQEACLNLRISPHKLKRILTEYGYPIYEFGTRTQRVREVDLRELIERSAKPTATEQVA